MMVIKNDLIKTVFTSCLLLIIQGISIAQIVSVEPTIFSLDEEITITYDATKGNAGLEGVSEIFAHTGVITQEDGLGNWQNVQGNWGQYDSRVRMTNIGNDLHQISYIPNDFYSLNGDKTVIQLAFVFRNVDGSKEGKTSSLGDIFLDVSDSEIFSAFLISPDEQHLVLELGESIDIQVGVSQPADIQIFDNNELLIAGNGNSLSYSLNPDETGTHLITYTADNGMEILDGRFSFVVIDDQIVIQDPPTVIQSGLNIIDDTQVIFSLFAPEKENVFLIGSFNDWQLEDQYRMKLSSDMETWWVELDQLDPNEIYGYQYIVDGTIKIADPYSSLILDDFNDQGISPTLNSVPKTYPRGFTSGHVSVFQTKSDDFDWTVSDFVIPDTRDLVIYELLLRDFLEDHSFDSLRDTLSYLKNLGVNAIELMPVNEYENNQSWGYNPSYHMALDKYYGSPNSLKQVIDEAHKLGIAVLLDIVYNHAFGQSPLVRLYWDKTLGKPATNSPYCNPDAKHPYNVGFDLNHESPAVKNYVKQTIAYWMDEFKLDGFRFDLSKGFTQKVSNGDGQFALLDQSRIDILKEYGDFIWNKNEDLIISLEHFAANDEEQILSDYGFLLWGNANYNFNEATMGYHDSGKSNFAHIYHRERLWSKPHLIGYMESHDEERLMYKNINFGNADGDYNVKDLSTGLDRVEMAAAFFFSIPGPKMLWQFGELGYDNSINRCEDGSINEDCRLSPKPIRWDYKEQQDRKDLFEVFKKMIELKTNFYPIKDGAVDMNVLNSMKRISLNSPLGNLCVIGNFGVASESINPQFPHAGQWFDYLNNRSFEVNDPNKLIALAPGEYRVFIDDKRFVTSVADQEINDNNIKIYPNPAHDLLYVDSKGNTTNNVSIELYDSQGQMIEHIITKNNSAIDIAHLNQGIYFVKMLEGNKILQTMKLVKI